MEYYLDTLSAFYEDCCERLQEVLQCVKDCDLHLFTTHVHGLKSAAAVIGADTLSETAAALEDAGVRKDLEYIETGVNEFSASLETLLNDIKGALSEA